MTTTKPAVGYILISTDKQEDSPAQQKAEISKRAQREDDGIIRWYEVHGIIGAKTLKRPEFRRRIRDADDRATSRIHRLADIRAGNPRESPTPTSTNCEITANPLIAITSFANSARNLKPFPGKDESGRKDLLE